jgi:cell wall-associated NlpC family hydrolase
VPATAAAAAPSVDEIQQRIRTASAELSKVVEEYNRVNEQLKASKAAAAEVVARLAPLQARLDTAQATVGELASRAYRTGQLATVGALLDSGSTGTLVDRLAVLDHVSRVEQRQVAEVVTARAEVAAEQRRLDALIATQTAQQKDLATRKEKIEKDLRALYELRRQAYGAAQESSSGASPSSAPAVSGRAGVAVTFAYGALGKPYVWAEDGPSGYDCSGLTLAAWRAAGVSLPHNAAMQWDVVAHIGRGSLQAGDLVFYSDLGHVAIYVGSGKVIHAPTFGEVVKVSSVDMMTPYGYGRPR